MSDIYNHDPKKFADAGLQLRVPVDLVPANQYSRLTNATPIIEGRLESRAALKWIVNVPNTTSPGSGLHSIARLNQPSATNVGDRVIGIDTTVQTLQLPSGSVATSRDTMRNGDPLSLTNFHFQNDTAAWQIIADRAGMRKYKGNPGGGSYNILGLASPHSQLNNAASAVDGGVGNLNNGAGPAYDWLYTYVNSATLSESNPSDVNLGVATYVHGPTAGATPDPSFGGGAGVGFAAGAGGALTASSTTETRQSGNWSAWPAGGPFQLLTLYLRIQVTAQNPGTTGGCIFGAAYLSLDSGTTWHLILDTLGNLSTSGMPAAGWLYPITLAVTQDPTRIQVRFVVFGVGSTTVPQNVTARRIREIGGNFNVASLLTGGGGNASIAVTLNQNQLIGYGITQTVTTLALANRQATVTCFNPVDPQVDFINLYRRGGSVTASWAFVGQFPVTAHDGSAFNVTDNVADTNLGSFVSFLNDAPVTSVYALGRPLPRIWGPGFNPSRLFGCGDPDRPDAVYFSNAGNADQWGVGQWVDVSSPSDPMQNGCVFNTRVFAFSKERMFELVPSLIGGSTVTPFQTPCSRGLISPWGLLATARMIYFVAKDGIYQTSGGEETSLVENDIKPLFPTLDQPLGRTVEGYDPVNLERIEDIRLAFHNDELHFIYRGINEGQLNELVYDQNKKRWRATNYGSVHIATVYSEEAGPASSLLLGDSTGSLYSTQIGTGDVLQASTPDISVTVRTGAYDQSMPLNQKEYGNVLFDLDPGGATIASPVTITPLLNGEAVTAAAITVTGTGRQQVPLTLGDVIGFNIEFQITFSRNAAINPVLYQFDILWRSEPAAVTHWEARETSNGLLGWQHMRDMYIPLRSNTTVTLTLTFDNAVTQTYTLASTAGLRQKVYVPLHANKFKLVRYSLDSSDVTQPFRIYEPDLEVRAKPWVTTLGYTVVKPFGAESSQASEILAGELLGGK
jgi:hypothetical protein